MTEVRMPKVLKFVSDALFFKHLHLFVDLLKSSPLAKITFSSPSEDSQPPSHQKIPRASYDMLSILGD